MTVSAVARKHDIAPGVHFRSRTELGLGKPKSADLLRCVWTMQRRATAENTTPFSITCCLILREWRWSNSLTAGASSQLPELTLKLSVAMWRLRHDDRPSWRDGASGARRYRHAEGNGWTRSWTHNL